MKPVRLILGSTSPRRREILESLRLPFSVRGASADETVLPDEDADLYLERVVLAKLDAVRASLSDADREREQSSLVLVADTSVILGETILGKPKDVADARATIEALAGNAHEVRTRFLLAPLAGEPVHGQTVTTRVLFRELDGAEIEEYVASEEGVDKAGAYAVQGLGASLVSRIEGSYSNVVGLPACELMVAYRRLARR